MFTNTVKRRVAPCIRDAQMLRCTSPRQAKLLLGSKVTSNRVFSLMLLLLRVIVYGVQNTVGETRHVLRKMRQGTCRYVQICKRIVVDRFSMFGYLTVK